MRIARDSNRVKGLPPGPSGSTIAGIRWLGVIFRNSGLNWSPPPILTGITLYCRPSSSSAICTLWPFGVGQVQTSNIGNSPAWLPRPPLRCGAVVPGLDQPRSVTCIEKKVDEPPPANPIHPRRASGVLARAPQVRSRHDRQGWVPPRRGNEFFREGRPLLHDVVWQGPEGREYPTQPQGRADGRSGKQLLGTAGCHGARALRDHRAGRRRAGGLRRDGRGPWHPDRTAAGGGRQRAEAGSAQNNSGEDYQLGPQQAWRGVLSSWSWVNQLAPPFPLQVHIAEAEE